MTTTRILLDSQTMTWLLDRQGREEMTTELQRQDEVTRENRRWEQLDQDEQDSLDRLQQRLDEEE
jgi:hypothetical protein